MYSDPSLRTPFGVRNPDIARAELRKSFDALGLSFRQFALRSSYVGIPAGTLNAIYNGYPIPRKWYPRFDIPYPATVQTVNGHYIPNGSQAIGARYCSGKKNPGCRNAYISNHPRRDNCFTCSPYRGKT